METIDFEKVQELLANEVCNNVDIPITYFDDFHNGDSYDGFISFCNGWNQIQIPLDDTNYIEINTDNNDALEAFESLKKTQEEFEEEYKDEFEPWEMPSGLTEKEFHINVRFIIQTNGKVNCGAYLNDDLTYNREWCSYAKCGNHPLKEYEVEFDGTQKDYERIILENTKGLCESFTLYR